MRTILSILLLGLFISCKNTTEKPKHDTLNVVFILADDLGYADIGCYGQTLYKTPNIDALASQGIKFTQHYAGSTVCAPSRASLMTGLHTGHTYIQGNNGNPDGFGQLPLPIGTKTLGHLFQENGYATGCFGKWGLGNAETTGGANKMGFDEFFGFYDQVLAHNSYPEYLFKNKDTVFLDNQVQYLSDTLWHKGLGSISTVKKTYANDLILNEALSFIKKNKEKPFYLYYPTTIPHMNDEADFDNRFEVPKSSQHLAENFTKPEKDYAALVQHLDNHVGQLTNLLDSLGIAENTLVVFTSDNGPVDTGKINSNGPLNGIKRDVYEGGIRVPMIVRWPSKIKAGTISNHISAFWDFLPTFSELINGNAPANDGISFLPELIGKPQPEHDFLYWEFEWWNPTLTAIRMGDFKGVQNDPESDWELYNLSVDIREKNNLANQHPELVRKMDSLANHIKNSRK